MILFCHLTSISEVVVYQVLMVNVVKNVLTNLLFYLSFRVLMNINRKSTRLFKNKNSIDLMKSQNNKLLEICSLNINGKQFEEKLYFKNN